MAIFGRVCSIVRSGWRGAAPTPLLLAWLAAPALSEQPQEAFDRAYAAAQAAPTMDLDQSWQAIRVEYWSKAIFSFSFKVDRSGCNFLIWLSDADDTFPNQVLDVGCDGTPDSVKMFGEADFERRPLSEFEARIYTFFLDVAADSFCAAAQIKAVNPQPRLALVPDTAAVAENRRLLQEIVDAATDSSLMGNPGHSDALPANDRSLRIFVNRGARHGGVSLGFSSKLIGSNRLQNCNVYYEEPGEDITLLDTNCDARFEAADDNGATRRLNAAGMEGVAKGMLLDVARFARVGNTYFSQK